MLHNYRESILRYVTRDGKAHTFSAAKIRSICGDMDTTTIVYDNGISTVSFTVPVAEPKIYEEYLAALGYLSEVSA